MGGKASRTKGHNFERAVASVLRAIFPDAKRGYQTRGGTAEAPDVDGTPWWVECKKMKVYPNILHALEQASAAKPDRPPLAVTAKDRTEPIASMYFRDFLVLAECIDIRKYQGLCAGEGESSDEHCSDS